VVEPLGSHSIVDVQVGDTILKVQEGARYAHDIGDRVELRFRTEGCTSSGEQGGGWCLKKRHHPEAGGGEDQDASDDKGGDGKVPLGPLIAKVATVKADGSPFLVPVWYEWDGEACYLVIRQRANWLKNIKHEPRVTVLLHNDRPLTRKSSSR